MICKFDDIICLFYKCIYGDVRGIYIVVSCGVGFCWGMGKLVYLFIYLFSIGF